MGVPSTTDRRWLAVVVTCACVVGLVTVAGGASVATQTENRTTVNHELTVSLTGVPADEQTRPVYVEIPNAAAGALDVQDIEVSGGGLTTGDAQFVDGPDGDGVAEMVAVGVSAGGSGPVSGSLTVTVTGSYPGGGSLDPGAVLTPGATGDAEFAVDTDSVLVRTALARANLSAEAIPSDAAVAAVHTPDGVAVSDAGARVAADSGPSVGVPLVRLDPVAAVSVTPSSIRLDPGDNGTVAVASTGEAPLSIQAPSLSGNTSAFEFDAPVGPLPPGTTGTVAVRHVGVGGEAATLALRTNATDRPVATVDLTAADPVTNERTEPSNGTPAEDAGGNRSVRTTVAETAGRTSVNLSVRNVSAGESVSLSVPETTGDSGEDGGVVVRNLSMTARESGDFNLSVSTGENVTGSMSPLRANGTEPLGYFAVTHSFENDAVSNASITVEVPRDRVAAMEDTDPEDVALYRNAGEGWSEERTEFLGASGDVYRYRVFAEGYSDWATAGKQPEFRIVETRLDAAAAVSVDDEVGVTVRIRNDGAAEGDYLTELWLNDEVVADREVSIAAGGTGQVIFERTVRRAGTYEVRVNNVTVDQIQVSAPEATTEAVDTRPDETDASDEPETADGSGDLSTTVVVAGLLLGVSAVVAVVYVRRER